MSNLRKAAEQALEALEAYATHRPLPGPCPVRDVEYALRAALAESQEPVQEPVAWAEQIIDDLNALHDSELIQEVDSGDALIRLYAAIAAVEEAEQRQTAPPQRKPLTDDEIDQIAIKCLDAPEPGWNRNLARAIEWAHGIR